MEGERERKENGRGEGRQEPESTVRPTLPDLSLQTPWWSVGGGPGLSPPQTSVTKGETGSLVSPPAMAAWTAFPAFCAPYSRRREGTCPRPPKEGPRVLPPCPLASRFLSAQQHPQESGSAARVGPTRCSALLRGGGLGSPEKRRGAPPKNSPTQHPAFPQH